MSDKAKILPRLEAALKEGKLLQSAYDNIKIWLDEDFLPIWALKSLEELIDAAAFEELNDRFFALIAFGTGGMRGRTIGKVLANSERGTLSAFGTPAHAAVGTNNMNDFTVARATIGLFNYCAAYCKNAKKGAPSLAIAYDVRHFSKHFCDLIASIWTSLGGKAQIFDGPRSTPQLSFSVRNLGCTAGIVVTASHNPSHDNGYKVYFEDGAQIISPHAEGIVSAVKSVSWGEVKKHLAIDVSKVAFVPKACEEAYIKAIEACVIDTQAMQSNKPKLVFTAVHGTGAALCPAVMRHFGLDPVLVAEQMVMDPRFPTVKQPNPEYPETLAMGIAKADEAGADCLMATDPDADRMGVAVRAKNGAMKLLTGNMIGALLEEYRIARMFEKGWISDASKCAIIKTFVTSPLQDAIALENGLKCVNTLTGFKWIGGKLEYYQQLLCAAVPNLNYDALTYAQRREMLQKHSTFFVFGGEESYGYLATDFVRDKDANAAVIMFSEMVAYLKSKGLTVDEYLDRIYLKYGYFYEELKSLYREGASGAKKIQDFLKIIGDSPLKEVGGVKVKSSVNFAKDDIVDADGQKISKEKFFFYELENGYKFAIRASGTEPKIKFYGFAKETVPSASKLDAAKAAAKAELSRLLNEIENIFDSLTA